MKKIIGLLCAAAMTFTVFAAPKTGVDGEMPKTTPFVLDDFEEGMYMIAVRDGWDAFGNVFMKTQFSTESKTAKSWTGKGNCGVLEYAALPGSASQAAIYECADMIENNWKDYKYMTVKVNNPNDYPVSMQLFTKTGSNYQWGSSPEAPSIAPGEHTIVFVLNSSTVAIPSKIMQFGFAFYIGQKVDASNVMIDDITLWTKK